jgi:hypothetical protein
MEQRRNSGDILVAGDSGGSARPEGGDVPRRAGQSRWSERTQAAFLRHLRRGRTVKAAAAAVGFSAANAYLLRRTRADFAAQWQAALAARRPPAAPATMLRYAPDGQKAGAPARCKRVRCLTQWSQEVEELFFDVLAATCNVRRACAEAGVAHTSVYRRRRLRPDFAAKWQAAVEQGYARLEVEFLRACAESVQGCEFAADRMIGPVGADTVLKLLGLHRAAATGQGKRPGVRATPPSVEQVRAEILRRVAAIRAARENPAGDRGEP